MDGRIHPARIEEMVEKAQKEVEANMREDGEAAALEVGIHGIHPELVIPFKLWTECTEAFYRSSTAFRNSCRRDRCRRTYGEACRTAS